MTRSGEFLRFYLHESLLIERKLAWEWLLYEARAAGIHGGSAFRAIGGFGSDRVMHEYKFFELADTQAIEVEFIVTPPEGDALLKRVEQAGVRIFYARIPATFGVIGPPRPEDEA